jgi:hypothetical protein
LTTPTFNSKISSNNIQKPEEGILNLDTIIEKREEYILNDDEIINLANFIKMIELVMMQIK